MLRRPPRSTRTTRSFPTRRSSDLALDAEGNFLALHADLVANMGAYLSGAGPNASTTASPTAMGGIYRIPHIFMQSRGVFTNTRSEEHTSELQSLMRSSYAVFCLKKKKYTHYTTRKYQVPVN